MKFFVPSLANTFWGHNLFILIPLRFDNLCGISFEIFIHLYHGKEKQ
jgi:hypothetical protein